MCPKPFALINKGERGASAHDDSEISGAINKIMGLTPHRYLVKD